MTPHLTKTERKLLTQAAASTFGRTESTRKGIAGVRETRAIVRLSKSGLLGSYVCIHSQEVRRGRTTRYSTVSATITDAGRAALETDR
jgi:hypothetical protein